MHWALTPRCTPFLVFTPSVDRHVFPCLTPLPAGAPQAARIVELEALLRAASPGSAAPSTADAASKARTAAVAPAKAAARIRQLEKQVGREQPSLDRCCVVCAARGCVPVNDWLQRQPLLAPEQVCFDVVRNESDLSNS